MQALRREAEDQAAQSDDGSLPLVNIAFLLLAFFVMAGAVAAADPFPVSPPAAAGTPVATAARHELLLGADGRLALDGIVLADGGLPQALAMLSAEQRRMLRLRADRGGEATRLVQVLHQLRQAGLQEVSLLTLAAELASP